MFRKNNQHQQPSFFNSDLLMPEKMRQQLYTSWAHTFRTMVLAQIPEERFAILYSEVDSRPNAPVNVLVGGDMLKSGFGWTDEELERHLQFDLQTRYALGLDDLSQPVPTLRTFQNLRCRVREHAEATGENLYQVAFEVVTDGQIQQLALKMGWQRMDSTQLLSNIAMISRLELVLRVLQQGVAALPPERQAVWQDAEADYVSRQPRHICYWLKDEEVPDYLQRVGQLLVALLAELEAEGEVGEAAALVARVLQEQYEIEGDEPVKLRPAAEVAADSLQSPHDPEATYREKHGEGYRGYVSNVSETCDPQNPVQLITSVQTASNNTDDGQLLAQSVAEQRERGHEIEKVTVDGGYTGPVAEAACGTETELHPSRVRGGKGKGEKWGWQAYTWHLSDEGVPQQVTCPQGQLIDLEPGRKAGRWLARFKRNTCADCPFFQDKCRVEPRERTGPTFSVTIRSIQVALLRQRITPTNNRIRAAVEATVRSLKHPFPGGKLPVRGVIRAHMLVCGSAVMVNVHRLCRYFQELPSSMDKEAPFASLLSLLSVFIAILAAWYRHLVAIFSQQPVALPSPSISTVSQPIRG